MSETALRGTLKTTIQGLTDEGVVHDYERWTAGDWAAFLALFKTTIESEDYIRGWTITMEAMPQVRHEMGDGGGIKLRAYNHRIRMYWGLDNSAASEKSAVAMAIAAVEALDASGTLHGGGTYYDADPASLETFEPRLFGGTLCHYAEILQVTYEVAN